MIEQLLLMYVVGALCFFVFVNSFTGHPLMRALAAEQLREDGEENADEERISRHLTIAFVIAAAIWPVSLAIMVRK